MKLHWAKPALRTWTIGVHGGRRTDVLAQGRLGPYMHIRMIRKEHRRDKSDAGLTQRPGLSNMETHNRLGRQRLKNRITWEQVRETEHRDTGEEGARERKRGQETWRVLNIASSVTTHTETQFSTQSYKNCSNCNLVLSLNEPSMNPGKLFSSTPSVSTPF